MILTAGSRLGPYEVLALIGAGGMGQVYRARDMRLDRDVALKVLPEAFAADPERIARFQREAKTLASLNHPNIAQIYGLEEADGVTALVLELVEGPTLADRIAQGAVPLDEALPVARQIADALEAAHDQGVIHRDLKPANVKVRHDGTVKVLDFGLAKALDPAPAGAANVANSPTLSMHPTQAGVILGTAAYMSPEQARGTMVDKRADLWAFGVVLYEMLTGQRLFEGATVSDTLAHLLTKDPDWSALPTTTPASVRRLLRRCLEKDRKRRLDSAADVGLEIDDARSSGTLDASSQTAAVAARRTAERLGWIVATAMTLATGIALWAPWRTTRPEDRPLSRYSVDLGPEAVAGRDRSVAVTPDGRRLVFSVRGPNGAPALATRLLDQATPTILRGTEGALYPFFSPDGQWVGFFADSKLKKVPVQGGASVVLSDAVNRFGGSWGANGIIAALGLVGGLSRIPAEGGIPVSVTKAEQGAFTHRWPQLLPDGKTVLLTSSASPDNFDAATIELRSLDTGQVTTLVRGGYFGRYVPSAGGTGYLMYIRGGTLYGAAFRPGDAKLRGPAVPLLDDVAANPLTGDGQFAVSSGGALYFRSGRSVVEDPYPVLWLDRSGTTTPLFARPGIYTWPRFSPDGRRVAFQDTMEGRRTLLVYDWAGDQLVRLNMTPSAPGNVWAPDGKHVVFSTASSASGFGLAWINAQGGTQRLLVETKNQILPGSFSPDGTRLAYAERTPETVWDMWELPLDTSRPDQPKPGQPEVLLRTASNELFQEFSPDGRWIAYISDASGRFEVYVQPAANDASGGRPAWQVSAGGGLYPAWSRDGRRLFYVGYHADGRSVDSLSVVDVGVRDGVIVLGDPRPWSTGTLRVSNLPPFDVHPDGQRVAMFPAAVADPEEPTSLHVTVLLNFVDELRRRVPLGK